MSYAIGLTVPDGVLVVSDSRASKLTSAGEYVYDGEGKIEVIAPNVVCVAAGILQLANAVIDDMRMQFASLDTLAAIRETQSELMDTAWKVLTAHRAGLDPDALVIGVLTIGLRDGGPFLVASLRHEIEGAMAKDVALDQPWGFWSIGAVDEKTQTKFRSAIRTINHSCQYDSACGPANAYLNLALTASSAAIRETEEQVPNLVGGPITAVIVRRDFGIHRLNVEEEL